MQMRIVSGSLFPSQSFGYYPLLIKGHIVYSFIFSEKKKYGMCLGIHCEIVLACMQFKNNKINLY